MIQLIILVLVVVGVMRLCGIKPPKPFWSFDSFKRKEKKYQSTVPHYNYCMAVREKLAQYSPEILRLRDTLNLAFAKRAKSSRAHEDRVIFPLLVACRISSTRYSS